MGDVIKNWLGASWVTSVWGILAAIFGGLAALPPGTLPEGLDGWWELLFTAVVGAGLIHAKSNNVTNAPHPAIAAIVETSVKHDTNAIVPVRKITK